MTGEDTEDTPLGHQGTDRKRGAQRNAAWGGRGKGSFPGVGTFNLALSNESALPGRVFEAGEQHVQRAGCLPAPGMLRSQRCWGWTPRLVVAVLERARRVPPPREKLESSHLGFNGKGPP